MPLLLPNLCKEMLFPSTTREEEFPNDPGFLSNEEKSHLSFFSQ